MPEPTFSDVVKWVTSAKDPSDLSEAMIAGHDADLSDKQRAILNSMAVARAFKLQQIIREISEAQT